MNSQQHMELDLFKIMLDASIIVQLDLLLLVLASVVSWGIIIRKILFFKELYIKNDHFNELFANANTLKEVHESCVSLEDSPTKRMFEAGYDEFVKMREAYSGDLLLLKDHFAQFSMVSLERAMNSAAVKADEQMGDSLTTLASIGSITPFVGLFGTVWGIIDSFSALAQGGATLETVAPGIAEALVATAVGLIAAIPAVWYFNKFSARKAKVAESLVVFREQFVNEIERILAKKSVS